jgi:RNA polymerase sigma-70 factor, ECF subfamily
MSTAMSTATPARALLDAARRGDEEAYRLLIEPYRRELHAHCYRILGSSHDADDALQEALLRAWRGLSRFEGGHSLRSWLYTIVTNAALRLIERRPKRVLPIDFAAHTALRDSDAPPLGESVWIEPYPEERLGLEDGDAAPQARYEQRESMELAFIAALQHLPANQRAVLVLREVLGFSAREVAGLLETTVASVNSALQRARRTVDERVPEQSQQATLRSLGDQRIQELVNEYIDAMERGDVDGVVAMLAEDVTWSMLAGQGDRVHGPTTWFRGLDAISAFLRGGPLSGNWRWRRVPTRANGQPAVAGYIWDAERAAYRLRVLDVLTLQDRRIAAVTAFLEPAVLTRFGLPDELELA